MKRLSRLILLLTLLPALLLQSSPVLAGDPSAWGEILNPDGSIRWENLQDLGVTSQQVDWTAITLPGGVTFQPDATYHRYMTPSGNILVLPSPMTLFFMALHPEQSNLNGAQSVLQNGAATLAMLVGPSLTSEQLAQIAQLGYTQPQDFFQAVIDGKANIWSVVNLTFLTDVLNASMQSGFLVNSFLLYLNGSANCASVPGGCTGLPPDCTTGVCVPVTSNCPLPSVTQAAATLSIQKTAPDHPLVVGQDPTRRGADIAVTASVPPVIFTWYEEIQDPPICQYDPTGQGAGCSGPGDRYAQVLDKNGSSTTWASRMVKNPYWKEVDGDIHCDKHVETLPDAIALVKATAQLNPASQSWILNDLAGKYYEAFLHQPNFGLLPDLAQTSTACDARKTCTASALVQNVPFADPGTFDLKLWVYTNGTLFNFRGKAFPITMPRVLYAENTAQVYVTLVTLVPAGVP